jgi:5,10-methenyltetrahydrofolate synthetase
MRPVHARGVIVALPVVETRAAPLVFRRWSPGARIMRGDWGIPVPPPGADRLAPEIVLAPCLGWACGCCRLGWGGGYFDRTRAALTPRLLTVGVALDRARLPTIHPQTNDIPST